jgi:hypothetical protein
VVYLQVTEEVPRRHGMVCRLVRVFKSIVKYRWKNRLSKKYLV